MSSERIGNLCDKNQPFLGQFRDQLPTPLAQINRLAIEITFHIEITPTTLPGMMKSYLILKKILLQISDRSKHVIATKDRNIMSSKDTLRLQRARTCRRGCFWIYSVHQPLT